MRTSKIIALAFATLLISCTKDDLAGTSADTGIPMQIVPSVSGSTKTSMQTADLQEFYLQVSCADASYSFFNRISWTGTAWGASRQPLWQNSNSTITYSAAYFSGHTFTAAEFANGVSLSIPVDQSTQAKLNSADLLTLSATQTSYNDTDNGVLPVTLSHGLAKVNFVVTLGEAFNKVYIGIVSNPIKDFTVKGANKGFKFKPQTGAVTVTAGTKADVTPLEGTYTPSTKNAKTATAIYEAILVPQSFAAGELSVTFSIGSYNYQWTNATAITLAAGQTVNLPVSTTAAPYLAKLNGHEYVEMGDGLKWATCNVGASRPWEDGDLYAWGEVETYYSSQNPLTWKEGKTDGYWWTSYKWVQGEFVAEPPGREGFAYIISKYTIADGVLYTSWYSYNNFIGDGLNTLDLSDDAAHYHWGDTWRMPTAAEWTVLFNMNNYAWDWIENYNGTGTDGLLVTNIVEGSVYKGNNIFLPAVTEFNCLERNEKHYGCVSYWSSSLSNKTIEAKAFDSGGHGRTITINVLRFIGAVVRPVSE